MNLKRLDELNLSELFLELDKAGIHGEVNESLAIVKLTIHLVSIREDPFTFLFNLDHELSIDEDGVIAESILERSVVGREASENVIESVAVPVLVLADVVSEISCPLVSSNVVGIADVESSIAVSVTPSSSRQSISLIASRAPLVSTRVSSNSKGECIHNHGNEVNFHYSCLSWKYCAMKPKHEKLKMWPPDFG